MLKKACEIAPGDLILVKGLPAGTRNQLYLCVNVALNLTLGCAVYTLSWLTTRHANSRLLPQMLKHKYKRITSLRAGDVIFDRIDDDFLLCVNISPDTYAHGFSTVSLLSNRYDQIILDCIHDRSEKTFEVICSHEET